MSRIHVDVLDGAGNKLGEGPVYPSSASVTEVLDGAGNISLGIPLTDVRALSLFQVERRVNIYYGGVLFGSGLVQSLRRSERASSQTLTATGPDLLNILQRKSTLRGRVFDNVAIGTVLSSLAGLAGWTATTAASDDVFVRFDGQSVLKALRAVAEGKGYHLRSGLTANSVEVGAFGTATGLYVFEAAVPGAGRNSDLLLIDTIDVVEDSKDVINWIEPIGGNGAGEGEQTLREAYEAGSRTVAGGYPYEIETVTGPRGQTIYYLRDTASIAAYGQIERVVPFSQVSPLSNNTTDAERGSEALYDLAAAWLARYSEPLTTLSVTVRPAVGVDTSLIRVGNKVRVTFKGVVERGGQPYTYLDVDDDYWIMKVNKSVGQEGVKYALVVSSVDRVALDSEEILLGALEAVQLRGVKVAQYLSHYRFMYEEELDSTHDAIIPLDVTAVTRTISRVLMRLTTRPFRATAQGAAAGGSAVAGSTSAGGGDHNHRVLAKTTISGFPSVTVEPYLGRESDGGAFAYFKLESNGKDLWTESSSGAHTHSVSINIPAHTHNLTYGITDDSSYPADVEVWVNGVDRTSALGGPWGSVGSGVDVELDLTAYINAAATLRQRHTITIKCGSGQGIAQGAIDVQETITSVDVSI